MKTILCIAFLCVVVQSYEQFAPYIVNGIRAPVAPYFAYIQFFQGNNNAWGGGALVSAQHIVTSASIVQPFERIRVFLGGNSRDTMREHPVHNFTAHPNFERNSRAFDVCVIRLVNPITPSAEIHAIDLPPTYQPPPIDMPFEHEEVFIDGLGITGTGRGNEPAPFIYRSHQRVSSEQRCRAFFVIDPDQAFCGEDREQRSNVCNGDLGSPVVGNYRRQQYLAGIVRIHPACGVNQPAAYTRISFFNMWIRAQMI